MVLIMYCFVIGMIVVSAINAALWMVAHRLLHQGYRIKA